MISGKTVARLSLYRRLLYELQEEGERNVFSHQLAALAGGTAAQVRRDMMALGYSGSPTRGYNVKRLIKSIASFLDAPEGQRIALVGLGNLGQAILAYFEGRRPKLRITAAFDTDPARVNCVIHGCQCYPVERMSSVVKKQHIEIGILTVPAEGAQQVAETLCAAGVRGLLNFTPARLHLPPEVDVEDYDISMCLEKVAYFARHARGPSRRKRSSVHL
jgi:redox-sensing transcriptional repressor